MTTAAPLDWLHRVLERSPDLVFIVDGGGRVAWASFHGRAALEGAHTLASAFARPETAGAVLAGDPGLGDQELSLVDGRVVLATVTPLPDTSLTLVALRDVTAHRILAQELEAARVQVASARLAGAVAQEVNGPLSVLLGGIELLLALPAPEPEGLRRRLTVLASHARRIGDIMRALEVLSASDPRRRERLTVAPLVREAVDLARLRRERTGFTVRARPARVTVLGDPRPLREALAAVIGVVAEAERLGQVRVEVTADDTTSRILIQGPATALPADVLSTLEGGPGPTSVTIGVAARVLADHGGRLSLGPEGGLEISLPRAAVPRGLPPAEGASVLVVDDDPHLTEVTVAMLKASGYRATGCLSAEEALTRLTEGFDALVADVALPGMSGLALREAVATVSPGLERRFVLVSGYSVRPPPGVSFLRKPYSRNSLVRALESVMTPTEEEP